MRIVMPVGDGAELSPEGRYRYALWRVWEPAAPRVAFVLLNPSTADATRDDPTIRRCVRFARRWGYGGVEVVNLFARRATAPAELRTAADPVGSANDEHIRTSAARVARVVLGWGGYGGCNGRDRAVVDLLGPFAPLYCLGTTANGSPRHPLYVSGATRLRPYRLPAPRGRPSRAVGRPKFKAVSR
jgi:hypothetical protein